MSKEEKTYLDFASTTPVAPEVVLAMRPYWSEIYANPGSIHSCGQSAIKAVDGARGIIQKFLGASSPHEIIFTGSATEANNLAICGPLGYPVAKWGDKPKIITTQIEHQSVLEPIRRLAEREQIEAVYLGVDKEGLINLEELKSLINEDTVLVSIGHANNEIGTIQPIQEAVKIVEELNPKIIFHTDAVQAVQFLESDVQKLGVDLMTISAHKIYGPKGIGALYVRDGIKMQPVIYGGGQEYGLRSGTENVPLMVGFAKALEILARWKTKENIEKIAKLRDYLWQEMQIWKRGFQVNGATGEKRLPNNLNVHIPDIDGETLIVALSEAGICVSSGSACASRSQKPSHVINALGGRETGANLRLTVGRPTSKADIDLFLEKFKPLI